MIQQPNDNAHRAGMVRLMFLIATPTILTLGFVVCLFAYRAGVADLKDLAFTALGAMIGSLTTIAVFMFSQGQASGKA